MSVVVYNTLSRSKEPFQPLEDRKVKIYCCGVTVYDYCHLGHARCYVVWDTVRRYLQWRGYDVHYVQNFTDIDDKILNRARKEGTTMGAISQQYIEAYHEDMARLNILEADQYTYATHTIDGIKRLIGELEQKGYAYAAGGDVYYKVRQFDGYGKLSGRKLDDMQAGASGRVDGGESKKQDPFDFALWKGAKPEEPSWKSPWGPGRPGWHIECSAMVRDHMGETIDIHMGGGDLTFPHHENEIAQSEAATGHPLSQYWMHNGMVNVNGEKMSKSLGNFTTIRQLLDAEDGLHPMALRLFLCQAQYRKPVDFTADAIASATKSWQTLKDGLLFGDNYGSQLHWPPVDSLELNHESEAVQRFQTAMDDDFNTPEAVAVLFELAKELRRQGNLLVHEGKTDADSEQLKQQWHALVGLAQVLGIYAELEETGDADSEGPSDEAITVLIEQRLAAKKAKDFALADKIREDLTAQGITLIDKPGGVTEWHR
ncbi:cysteine--tRNA ligase [Leptolyngbya cf. ectocarpi LEGE 11479]|uniref:Cysteine--tRNA ligase n=1 Tax=Leptolyngbya cf. ectocarpi LEGE 11479 TaxID=1828722 RepID=A0A928ZVV5_LEPEC|nr:cysteine--tRNA ligase [Leptolyngbya ectocarpi]MBE9068399.1 cysteine--tRNA ligase [Leptolyngbya cf. ectocarpi LEGE 11479]